MVEQWMDGEAVDEYMKYSNHKTQTINEKFSW